MATTVTPSQAILIGFIVAPTLLVLSAYYTRASLRRAASGLAGVIPFVAIQYAWDRIAAVTGWWSYPAYGTPRNMPMPLAIYIFSGLAYASFGLIGWRIVRRWGWKGSLVFIAAWSLWGFAHDIGGSALFSSSQLMVISPGIIPLVVDFAVYATCMAAVLLTIRAVGGPFRSDALRGASKSTAVP